MSLELQGMFSTNLDKIFDSSLVCFRQLDLLLWNTLQPRAAFKANLRACSPFDYSCDYRIYPL